MIHQLQGAVEFTEVRQRKFNLIFEGVAETNNEDTKQVAIDLLRKSSIASPPSNDHIDTAYRLGRISEGTTRSILVVFKDLHAKDYVLNNAPHIRKSINSKTLWINRDHPELTRKQISNTRKCFNLMRSNNHPCKINGTSITYNNQVYHYKDLNRLLEGSHLEDTRFLHKYSFNITTMMSGEYVNCYPSINSYPNSNILIIADSRGHDLDTYLSDIIRCNLRIITCRGADLLNSILRSKFHIEDLPWTQIYCLAGICGLTRKEKISRRVILRQIDPESAANTYKNCLEQAESEIRLHLRDKSCKIIFGPVTGMNLCTYNRCTETRYRDNLQGILNTTIKLVNKEIFKVNESNSVATPWLTRIVHRRHRKSYMNSYHRLQPDGCHLSPEILNHWALALKKAIINNMILKSLDEIFTGMCFCV